MQNQSNREVTFDTQLRTALVAVDKLTLLWWEVDRECSGKLLAKVLFSWSLLYATRT